MVAVSVFILSWIPPSSVHVLLAFQGQRRFYEAILRTVPVWLTILLFILTRLKPIGLRNRLHDTDPHFSINLRHLCGFKLSAWLVTQVTSILGVAADDLQWRFELLYEPFLLPFLVASAITVGTFRRNLPAGSSVFTPFRAAFRRYDL
jgi:hypothetical protein